MCGSISQYNNKPGDDRSGDPMVRLKKMGLPVLGRKGHKEGFSFINFAARFWRCAEEGSSREGAVWCPCRAAGSLRNPYAYSCIYEEEPAER